MLLLFAVGSATEVYSQGFIDRLGKKVGKAAENAVTKKAEKATEKAIDKATDPETYKGDGNNQQQQAGQTDATAQSGTVQQRQSAEMAWNKFDFVSGDEIIFEDYQANEQLGEFPSQWDLIKGNVEISKINGENVIALIKSAGINPLMKAPKNYLPEDYTIEFDFYKAGHNRTDAGYIDGTYHFYIKDGNKNVLRIYDLWGYLGNSHFGKQFRANILSTGGETRKIDEAVAYNDGWNRMSISFNKRALKVYINETRVVNAPNVAQGGWFSIETQTNGGSSPTFFIRNIRIAKGAVPLYDRMMSDGKFITYGITFDVGKSTIKPESMGEINRIVQLMNENPTLKFSVEGHTDSTGNPASNQTLSEARSKAIVDKLVSLGISADRLTASGKGQNNPIDDNSTDEGRAKNRRVEFVKI
jgi:outer membrane protein OmpA-like peptidoglycan-associated protein